MSFWIVDHRGMEAESSFCPLAFRFILFTVIFVCFLSCILPCFFASSRAFFFLSIFGFFLAIFDSRALLNRFAKFFFDLFRFTGCASLAQISFDSMEY